MNGSKKPMKSGTPGEIMKSKYRNRKTVAAISMALTVIALSGCTLGKRDDAELANGLLKNPADNFVGTAGMRNATQLNQSMSAVTGVSVGDTGAPNVQTLFQTLKPRLSADGNVQAVGPSMMLAQTTLASGYCKRLIDIDAALATGSRRAFNGVDFTKDATALTTAVRGDVFKSMANLFLRRDLTAAEIQILSDSVDESVTALKAANVTGANQTKSALLVPCTALLGGLEFAKS